MSELYPFLFKPVYKDYIWGGDKIIQYFEREEDAGIYAESWEISERPEGMSVLMNGELAGKSLAELVDRYGKDLLGTRVSGDGFPLLIKLIDSKQDLSIQVHPDDDTAAQWGGEAKTEMWYILAAEPGACLYAGLKDGTTKDEFRRAVESGSTDQCIEKIPVQAGDTTFIPGGRVHAIGSGCLILEVQQNSNTTYRIFDWNRVGADGHPRDLHIDEAMRVIRWEETGAEKVEPKKLGDSDVNERWEVLSCPYFRMERMLMYENEDGEMDGSTFHALFVVRGEVECSWGEEGCMQLHAGVSCLFPAGMVNYSLMPFGDQTEVLRITIP